MIEADILWIPWMYLRKRKKEIASGHCMQRTVIIIYTIGQKVNHLCSIDGFGSGINVIQDLTLL